MYYLKECIDEQWKKFKFSAEEVVTIRNITIAEGLKTYTAIDAVATAKGVQLDQAQRDELFKKAAPTYAELAMDILSDKLAKQKKEVAV